MNFNLQYQFHISVAHLYEDIAFQIFRRRKARLIFRNGFSVQTVFGKSRELRRNRAFKINTDTTKYYLLLCIQQAEKKVRVIFSILSTDTFEMNFIMEGPGNQL